MTWITCVLWGACRGHVWLAEAKSGPCLDLAGAMSGLCRGHVGTLPGLCLDLAGAVPGPCRGHVGTLSGLCWDLVGVMLGLPVPGRKNCEKAFNSEAKAVPVFEKVKEAFQHWIVSMWVERKRQSLFSREHLRASALKPSFYLPSSTPFSTTLAFAPFYSWFYFLLVLPACFHIYGFVELYSYLYILRFSTLLGTELRPMLGWNNFDVIS